MLKDITKARDRLTSESIASTNEQTDNNDSPLTVKPKEDPDAPPVLELEALKLNDSYEDQESKPEGALAEDCVLRRDRTRSEEFDSILGFLQKKMRNRNMSEQIHDKPISTDPQN